MINLLAPINNSTGYGISSTNIWQKIRTKQDVSLFPIGGVSIEKQFHNDAQTDINNSLYSSNKTSPCLKIWHMQDLFSRVGNGTYAVLPFFEIDKFKPIEVACLKHADIIFSTCEWAKQVTIQNGFSEDTIKICPLGVDHTVFNTNNSIPNINKQSYVFINIGKWEIRKSHDLLIYIFNEAFTKEDDVELWMINHNPFLKPEDTEKWQSLYKNSKLGDKITIYPRLSTHQELANTIGQADCGVYISRAEGWNNEILETMAMNKPVIATNYSAHTEYCTKENSYLVDIDSVEPAIDGIWFDGFGKWAKIGAKQIEQTIEHMRYCYKNRIRTNPNGLETSHRFTWENSANSILQHLV